VAKAGLPLGAALPLMMHTAKGAAKQAIDGMFAREPMVITGTANGLMNKILSSCSFLYPDAFTNFLANLVWHQVPGRE